MGKQPAFVRLDMTMLPMTERTMVFEDELMFVDNFEPISKIAGLQSLAARGAFKIDFTISVLCTAGYVRLRRNFKECRLEANDMFVAFKGDIVECLEIGKDCQVGVIVSRKNRMLGIDSSPMTVFFRKYMTKHSVFHFSMEEVSENIYVYNQMRRKLAQRDCRFMRMALLGYIQVLGSIGCQWATNHCAENEAKTESDKSRQTILDDFFDLVERNFRQERMTEFYADKLCLTPKYLSGILLQLSGLSASEWIKDRVITEAKELLRSKRFTVVQVSEMLNFSNASFFGKYFKAATGSTPRQFMLQ